MSDKELVTDIIKAIRRANIVPDQYVGIFLDAVRHGMESLADEASITYDKSKGRAVVKIAFENGIIGTIEYYLNERELRSIFNSLNNIYFGGSLKTSCDVK